MGEFWISQKRSLERDYRKDVGRPSQKGNYLFAQVGDIKNKNLMFYSWNNDTLIHRYLSSRVQHRLLLIETSVGRLATQAWVTSSYSPSSILCKPLGKVKKYNFLRTLQSIKARLIKFSNYFWPAHTTNFVIISSMLQTITVFSSVFPATNLLETIAFLYLFSS